jgi:CubicO group peptidase (beta-lactamase class C family)
MAGSLAAQWDQARLSALVAELASGGSTALIVQQAGEPVLAAGQIDRKTSVASVRKSLISLLYGIHVQEGRIDLDATLADYRIDDLQPLSAVETTATVRHLLTSRSGVYHPSVYDIDRDRPKRGSHAPGSHFYYNNWDFNVLGTIFERATGEGLFRAFTERLAAPLGMEEFNPTDLYFEHEPQSRHPVYKMRLSARDLLRVGQLCLQNGAWDGRQLVPEAWLRESTRPHVDLGGGRGYGYLWWSAAAHAPGDRLHADVPIFYASGLGGQYIIVAPDHDLVVVHRAARVDHGIDHGRMGEIFDSILEAMPRAAGR